MIIKYINEGAFDSYKNKGIKSKEEKRADLRKMTSKIMHQAFEKEFINTLRPTINEIFDKCVDKINNHYINLRTYMGLEFMFDEKLLEFKLEESSDPEYKYDFTIFFPVWHFLENIVVKLIPNRNKGESSRGNLYEVVNEIIESFTFSKELRDEYENHFKESFDNIRINVKLHLINNDKDTISYGIALKSMKELEKLNSEFFDLFDNYAIQCKQFTIQCKDLDFTDFMIFAKILENHIICDKLHLLECNRHLKTMKGAEKLISFSKPLSSNIKIYFRNTFLNSPGIGLKDENKVCSEELIKEITGKTYDDIIIENRAIFPVPSRITKEEDKVMYQVQHSKLSSIFYNIDENGNPEKNSYKVQIDTIL